MVYFNHPDSSWWRHQMETFSALLALCAGYSPVNSSHKDQWRGALMFSFFCAWINDWVKNREAGDLRRHRAHYDVTVMSLYWEYWPLTNPIIARCPAIDPNFPSQSIVWCVAHLSRVSAYELSHIRSIVLQGAQCFSIHEDIIAWINHDIVTQVINCLFI